MANGAPKKKKSKTLWLVVLLISLLAVGVALGILLWLNYGSNNGHAAYDPHLETTLAPITTQPPSTAAPTEQTQETTVTLADNPVDFPALLAQNDDVIGWIFIPNADISLPVMQSQGDEDDNLYLHRDMDKNYDFKGMIYVQKANAPDFSDPVTVVYGHNMLDGTMFSNLHMFRDATFFDENEFFYIYRPGHILTYRIVSAYQYDTRHILNSFDFTKTEVLQEYHDSILHPRAMISDVREDVTLTTEDRIVTLSTCIERGAARYLVQGVLTEDEPTN